MAQSLPQLSMTVLWPLYKQACVDGLTMAEFYARDIEGKFGISENSLSSKISNGKADLEIGASVYEFKGEKITGSKLVLVKGADGQRLFKSLTEVRDSDKVKLVKAADLSGFPTLKGSGRGRQVQEVDHGALLNDLISA